MDWRREDWGYAGATIAAAALVGYLVAGNFGLVRTPFGRAEAAGAPAVPAVASPPGSSSIARPAIAPPSRTASSTQPPASSPTGDSTAPTARITSPGGTVVSATEASKVSGTATDDGSGVKSVVVAFDRGSGDVTTVPADVSCEDASRTRCRWTADVPDVAGDYEVTARVTDRFGNTSASEPMHTTVVNLGGALTGLAGDEPIEQLLVLLNGLLG